jgi:hypothetical protein
MARGVEKQSVRNSIQFELFTVAWSLATLFHMANHRSFSNSLINFLLTCACIIVIVKPSSKTRFFILVFLQLCEVFIKMPNVTNHWIFTAFVNLTILQAYVYLTLKQKSFRFTKDDLIKTFTNAVRVELLILYFYVVFHKLNAGFFIPESSCATDFFVSQNSFGLLPSNRSLLVMNVYLTIGIEILIPVLLCFRKARNWGVLLGLLFHGVIAYNPTNGFYDFSSMLFGTYILFINPNFSDYVFRLFKKIKFNLKKKSELNYNFSYIKFMLSVFLSCVLFSFLYFMTLTRSGDNYFRDILWTAYCLFFIFLFIAWMVKSRKLKLTKLQPPLGLPKGSFLLFPILVLINGFSPYLGLKTESSFAMFSNLRTEGNISNHYLVPATTQVFDFQKDLVEIISSTDPELSKLAAKKQLMVYFSFKNHVAFFKPERVEYLRNAQHFTYVKNISETHSGLDQRSPFWQRKFLSFRTISKFDPQPCNH